MQLILLNKNLLDATLSRMPVHTSILISKKVVLAYEDDGDHSLETLVLTVRNGCLVVCKTLFSVRVCATSSYKI